MTGNVCVCVCVCKRVKQGLCSASHGTHGMCRALLRYCRAVLRRCRAVLRRCRARLLNSTQYAVAFSDQLGRRRLQQQRKVQWDIGKAPDWCLPYFSKVSLLHNLLEKVTTKLPFENIHLQQQMIQLNADRMAQNLEILSENFYFLSLSLLCSTRRTRTLIRFIISTMLSLPGANCKSHGQNLVRHKQYK